MGLFKRKSKQFSFKWIEYSSFNLLQYFYRIYTTVAPNTNLIINISEDAWFEIQLDHTNTLQGIFRAIEKILF